jgi:large subunit ribosomal protein L13
MTPTTTIVREWHIIDAKGQILGRIATQVAGLLTGRSKTSWSPMQDVGDHVVVINTSHVRLSSDKAERKVYRHHTTYLGHLKEELYKDVLAAKPNEAVRRAIVGMLPRTRRRSGMLRRLHLFAQAEHPYQEQLKKNS